LAARFALNESGATAIEYGLIVALIAVVIIGALTAVSGTIQTDLYDNINNAIDG
jgi:pilus assembly protein Flp/PilA